MRAGNRVPTLCQYYAEYDQDFRDVKNEAIESNGNGSCLLRLLKVCEGMNDKDNYSINSLIREAMHKYVRIDARTEAYGFIFDDNDGPSIRLNPTLEDVLYLTGFPIIGKPVLPEKSRDLDAFTRVFEVNAVKDLSLPMLQSIAKDVSSSTLKRITAVLLLIINCMIIPSQDGHRCSSRYVQFVEKLEDVNSYAWGVALLGFLYKGMKAFANDEKKSIDGNTSFLVAFLIYRILKIQEALKIKVERVEQPALFWTPVLHALRPICHDTKSLPAVVNPILNNITDEDICWRPYASNLVMPDLHQQLVYKTLLAPLFCYNFVVNHSPHLVAKQFHEFEGQDTSMFGNFLMPITDLGNSGFQSYDEALKAYSMMSQSPSLSEGSTSSEKHSVKATFERQDRKITLEGHPEALCSLIKNTNIGL